jgi:hypothetical protein
VFGACKGQVVPAGETCAEPEDEDCSGFDCARWSAIFGESGLVSPSLVRAGSDGDVYVAGHLAGSVTFGSRTLVSAGLDAFLVKLDGAGQPQWSKRFGPGGDGQAIQGMAAGPAGEVAVAGAFGGSIDLDDVTLTATTNDAWVALFAADGTLTWAKHVVGSGNDGTNRVAVLSDGDVIVTGYFNQTLAVDGDVWTSAGGVDFYVLRLAAATGDVVWAQHYGSSGDEGPTGLGVDASDNIVVAGQLSGGPLTFPPGKQVTSTGQGDVFVARLDSAGNTLWAKGYGGIEHESGGAVAVGPVGEVFVMGRFTGTADFHGAAGQLTAAAVGGDLFLLKLSSLGQSEWVRQVGGPDATVAEGGLAAQPDGSVVAVSTFDGTLVLQPANITSDGNDALVTKLGPAGGRLWFRHVEAFESQFAADVAPYDGDAIVVGATRSAVDLGTGKLSGKGTQNMWVARYAP